MPPNGLHAALILSKKPHARILAIDNSVAKSSPGFAGIFFAKHVPGINMVGPVVVDEELFASEVVTCVGQVNIQFLLWLGNIFFISLGMWLSCVSKWSNQTFD